MVEPPLVEAVHIRLGNFRMLLFFVIPVHPYEVKYFRNAVHVPLFEMVQTFTARFAQDAKCAKNYFVSAGRQK
jgi:hypothetical protein